MGVGWLIFLSPSSKKATQSANKQATYTCGEGQTYCTHVCQPQLYQKQSGGGSLVGARRPTTEHVNRKHKSKTPPQKTIRHRQKQPNNNGQHSRFSSLDCSSITDKTPGHYSCCAQCNIVTLGRRLLIQPSAVGNRSLMWPYHITGTPGCSTPLCSALYTAHRVGKCRGLSRSRSA